MEKKTTEEGKKLTLSLERRGHGLAASCAWRGTDVGVVGLGVSWGEGGVRGEGGVGSCATAADRPHLDGLGSFVASRPALGPSGSPPVSEVVGSHREEAVGRGWREGEGVKG